MEPKAYARPAHGREAVLLHDAVLEYDYVWTSAPGEGAAGRHQRLVAPAPVENIFCDICNPTTPLRSDCLPQSEPLRNRGRIIDNRI